MVSDAHVRVGPLLQHEDSALTLAAAAGATAVVQHVLAATPSTASAGATVRAADVSRALRLPWCSTFDRLLGRCALRFHRWVGVLVFCVVGAGWCSSGRCGRGERDQQGGCGYVVGRVCRMCCLVGRWSRASQCGRVCWRPLVHCNIAGWLHGPHTGRNVWKQANRGGAPGCAGRRREPVQPGACCVCT